MTAVMACQCEPAQVDTLESFFAEPVLESEKDAPRWRDGSVAIAVSCPKFPDFLAEQVLQQTELTREDLFFVVRQAKKSRFLSTNHRPLDGREIALLTELFRVSREFALDADFAAFQLAVFTEVERSARIRDFCLPPWTQPPRVSPL